MSPKQRLHLDKNAVQVMAERVKHPGLRGAIDVALLEMQHQCARSDLDSSYSQWKQTGALEFVEILLNLADKPEGRKYQQPTQLNHDV